MYPASSTFQKRPISPPFVNISSSDEHSNSGTISAPSAALESLSMRHQSMAGRKPKTMPNKSRSTSGQHATGANVMSLIGADSIGHRHNELIFSDNMDNIEFCMPQLPASKDDVEHGLNGEMALLHGVTGMYKDGDICTERRRRGHARRSNHKIDVEQQVKWSRKNIAATMERFEPSPHSSSSTSSLEYGFAAGVVTPSTMPSHQLDMSSTQHLHVSGGGAVPANHLYSYAYYELGAAKCHTNVPLKGEPPLQKVPLPPFVAGRSKSPPRNSIRALLSKNFRSKPNSDQSTSSSPSAEDRHTYTTRYGTTENLYEEVNDQKIRKVLSDNRIATSNVGNVKEELRRVQHNHFRVLDELNLSLEALIMPPTPPDVSPNNADEDDEQTANSGAIVTAATTASATSQRCRRGGLLGGASSSSSTSSHNRPLSHASLENLSSTLNSMDLKDQAQSSCINPEFDEGDLDSGFSGSGSSSGASYNESLRYFKSNAPTTANNIRSCRSSTASGTSISKSSMASYDDQGISMMTPISDCGITVASSLKYPQRCLDTHRASIRSASASSGSGTKPKKNFWTMKP